MDPITQGILGATASQAVAFKNHWHRGTDAAENANSQRINQIFIITCIGFVTGTVPDLDVLITSETDPLLFLQYHRHFTHSLFFIPIAGLVTAAILFLLVGKRFALQFKQICCCCTAAFATHALLDACTSYGTQLMWPFNDIRYAWNIMSIIDPFYTLPIISFVACGVICKNSKWAYLACLWVLCYPLLGLVQRERAESEALHLVQAREHGKITGLTVKPSLGNLILWKSIYEYQDDFYVDAVRVAFTSKVYKGDRIKKLAAYENLQIHFPWLDLASQQARDIERFRWFSQGYVAQNPVYPEQVMDMRYSMLPNAIAPLWSIELSIEAAPEQHARYISARDTQDPPTERLWEMLLGN